MVVRPADQRITPWATRSARSRVPSTGPAGNADGRRGEAEEIGEPLGVLISRGWPDVGTEYVVGGKPVSIGSGARCARAHHDPTLAAEEARIWVRDGHLMLHKMTRLTRCRATGVSGGWAILEPGDTFDIGEHRSSSGSGRRPCRRSRKPAATIPNILRETPRAMPTSRHVLTPATGHGARRHDGRATDVARSARH